MAFRTVRKKAPRRHSMMTFFEQLCKAFLGDTVRRVEQFEKRFRGENVWRFEQL